VPAFQLRLRGSEPKKGWLVVTAGLGSVSYEAAALRVVSQAASLPNISKSVAVTTSDLAEVCPQTTSVYGPLQNENHPGWGYWAFKSEILNRGLTGYWGQFEGVVWIDSGCEVCINPISRWRFRYFQNKAARLGATVFSLVTPEFKFTKRDLFNEFPNLDSNDPTNQIQATWFMLHGETGRRISKSWLEVTLKSVSYSNEEPSLKGELKEFISHRHDQSIFSLVCKSEGVSPIKYTPATGSHSILGRIRALSHPIWVSRNRTGVSIIPKSLQKFPKVFYRIKR
jgi:hypothetical protein